MIFNQWDANNLGILRPDDVKHEIEKLGFPVSLDESRAIVAAYDKTKTGALSLTDFQTFLMDPNPM
jgi:Ca2+-binding EF-hand superfamily protein